MLHSAVPALIERVKAPQAPVLDPLLLYPVPSQGSSQRNPLDIRAASLALTLHHPLIRVPPGYPQGLPAHLLPTPGATAGAGLGTCTGNTDSVQTTAGKQFWVRLQQEFRFPRALRQSRAVRGQRGGDSTQTGRSRVRSGALQAGAAMGDAFIRHIELLGYEKRFFPSQHYVSTQQRSGM